LFAIALRLVRRRARPFACSCVSALSMFAAPMLRFPLLLGLLRLLWLLCVLRFLYLFAALLSARSACSACSCLLASLLSL
jgi:hypothetical protein